MAGPFKPNRTSPAATIPSPAEPSRRVKVLCSPILIRSQLPKQHQLVSVSSAEDLDECDGLLEHPEYGFSEDSGQGYIEPINQNQVNASEPDACKMEIARGDGFINEEQGRTNYHSPQHRFIFAPAKIILVGW